MALDEQQRQLIRDEEYLRHEIRQELAGHQSPSRWGSIAAFFESKVGFWLLTTVMVSAAALAYRSFDSFLRREEIRQTQIAQRARQDTETVIKLGPMLTSDKETERGVAIVLLDRLASDNAINTEVASQVKSLFQNALASGTKKDATPEERAQANSILAYVDRARMASIETASPVAVAVPAVSKVIDDASLPVRVYLQVARKDDREKAEKVRGLLRDAGLVVPGIEMVSESRAPSENQLRYCQGKTDAATVGRVTDAVAAAVASVKVVKMNPNICGKVRYHHYELWLTGPR
jgi:hypothetical protein